MAILVSIVKSDVPHLLRCLSKEINEGPNWTQGQGEFKIANMWNHEAVSVKVREPELNWAQFEVLCLH